MTTLSEQYDRRARAYGRDCRACDYRFKGSFLQRQQVILKWLQADFTDVCKILDVGCGPGLLTAPLAGKNFLTGLDFSQGMLLRAQETLRPVRGEAEQLPFKNGSFDAVLAVEIIQHLKTPDLLLKELSRVVRPKGRIILSTLNENSVLHRVLLRLGILKHDHIFHPLEKICRVLAGEGWKPAEIRFLGFPLPVTWKVRPESPRFSPLAASWAACFRESQT